MAAVFPNFLESPVDEVARKLLGCELVREIDDQTVRVRIVETESYDQNDVASHAYGGPTKRNQVMFGPAGRLYVYFTYGMHYCCNVVSGKEGYGSGVLIRAVQPIEGQQVVEERRGKVGYNATNGPAKLTKALAIDFELLGHDLRQGPLQLFAGNLESHESIASSPRIGISKNRQARRRHFIKGNDYLSR